MAIDGSGGPEFKRRRLAPSGAAGSSNPDPGAGGRPRRNSAAAIRRPPGRCSSRRASAPSPQATVIAPPPAARTSPGRGGAGRQGPNRAAPAGDRLAAEGAARAGKRIEGAQPPLDRRRRLAPVDRRLGLVDLGGVADAGSVGCGRGCSRPAAASARPRTASAPPRSASRAAAWRWCRRRRSAWPRVSRMAPVSRPASICIRVTPVSASPASIARWIGAAPRQRGRSEAWMLMQPSGGSASTQGGRIRP